MEISQLRYFLAVAETGSISRAALRREVAQPSLSQQIRKLEEQLGHRLFDRLARGVVLTEAGRALVPYARRILAEVNAIESVIQSDLKAGRGTLRVGAIPTMAPFLLPPLVERFSGTFPDCQLTLREDFTERLVEALMDQELDLGIMSTPIEPEVLQLEVLGRERLVVASHRDYTPPRSAARLAISDLQDQPVVVLHEIHCLGAQIESFCSARRVKRSIVCRTTQLATVLELVALGLGISLVPEMCAAADRGTARSYWPFRGAGPSREIAVVYRVDVTRSRLAKAFIQMLREDVAGGKHRFNGSRKGNS